MGNLEQYGRKLCLRILNVDGDDSEISDDVFHKSKELLNNLELDILEAYMYRAYRIRKKITGRVTPIIVRARQGVTARWSIVNGKIASTV